MFWTLSAALLVLGLLSLAGVWTFVSFIDGVLVVSILFVLFKVIRGKRNTSSL